MTGMCNESCVMYNLCIMNFDRFWYINPQKHHMIIKKKLKKNVAYGHSTLTLSNTNKEEHGGASQRQEYSHKDKVCVCVFV